MGVFVCWSAGWDGDVISSATGSRSWESSSAIDTFPRPIEWFIQQIPNQYGIVLLEAGWVRRVGEEGG